MAEVRPHARIHYRSAGGRGSVTIEAESTSQIDAMIVNCLAELRADSSVIERVDLTDAAGDEWVYTYQKTPEGFVTHIEKNGVSHY